MFFLEKNVPLIPLLLRLLFLNIDFFFFFLRTWQVAGTSEKP
jgi:hypothetical protein